MTDNLSSDLASLRIDRTTASPPSQAWKKWLGLAALLAALAVAYRVGRPYLEAQVFKTPVETTSVVTLSPAQADIELTSSGYAVADQRARIAPKVAGHVAAIHVERGQHVQAGDLLVELETDDSEAAIVTAQSQVAAARARTASIRAQIPIARAQLAEAEQSLRREEALVAQGVTGRAVVEDLRARLKSLSEAVAAAEAQERAAQAEVAALGAQVAALRVGLKHLALRAPIAGTVVNEPPQVGEFIGPQPPGVTADMGGIEIADFSTLEIETDVAEQRLYLVKVGGPAEIVFDAFPKDRFRGEVKEITPRVDRAKATVAVRVRLVDPAPRALPDMSARVSFLTKALDKAAMAEAPKTIVPSAAVVERDGAHFVFAIEGDHVRRVRVELGASFGGGFEVLSGPISGTTLVAHPPDTLAEGQKIKEIEDD